MNTRHLRFTALLCFTCSGFAQQTQITSRHHMTLYVVVADRKGKPVTGLQQSDFTLLDNKHPQNITSFKEVNGIGPSAPPLEGVIVVDEVNTRFANVSFARAQVDKFLRSNNGKLPYPMSVAVFTDAGIKTGNEPTTSGNALATALDTNPAGLRFIHRDKGDYGAGDRLDLSVMSLSQFLDQEGARPGQKLVFWISPGWPIFTGPRIQLSPNDRASIFQNVVNLSEQLINGDFTMYSIDPLGSNDVGQGRTYYYQEFVKGVKKPDQVQMGYLSLQVLAIQTGGEAFNTSNDVAGEIAQAVADRNAYYVITFDPATGDGPNEYHALQLKLDRKGLKVHARTGYYAQP